MKARKLIDGSVFDADIVKMMGGVLEGVWTTIEPAFRAQSPTTQESARGLIATSILASVASGLLNPDTLRDQALSVVKRNFPQHLP